MRPVFRLTPVLLAVFASPLGGCFLPALFGLGGGGKSPSSANPPGPVQAVGGVPGTGTEKAAIGRPASVAAKPPGPAPVPGSQLHYGVDWEFRTYAYHPVGADGGSELGRLVAGLGRQGWEVHTLQVRPGGQNFVTFRRQKRMPTNAQTGLPGLQQDAAASGSGSPARISPARAGEAPSGSAPRPAPAARSASPQ